MRSIQRCVLVADGIRFGGRVEQIGCDASILRRHSVERIHHPEYFHR
jgi:hypothetical protein